MEGLRLVRYNQKDLEEMLQAREDSEDYDASFKQDDDEDDDYDDEDYDKEVGLAQELHSEAKLDPVEARRAMKKKHKADTEFEEFLKSFVKVSSRHSLGPIFVMCF